MGQKLSKRQNVRNTLVMLDKDVLVVRENNPSKMAITSFKLKEAAVVKEEKKLKPQSGTNNIKLFMPQLIKCCKLWLKFDADKWTTVPFDLTLEASA